MILLNPKKYAPDHLDPASAELMRATIAFFEQKGRARLKHDDRHQVWYADFLAFLREHQVFAKLLTPAAYGGGDASVRWDTFRNCDFNELTGFYGLAYWYTWQVSILGLGPIWMSPNEGVKRKTAELLRAGGIFAFGLSEREHGADLYASGVTLTPDGAGGYRANGSKYYIGNANRAALVSTFGKVGAAAAPDGAASEFVFFAVESTHPAYELVQNVVNSQSYVAEYALHDYPIAESDILSRGQEAWDAALNTVNVGKFNLGWASIGICTHAFYEAIDHAAGRILYGHPVTDFPHVRQLFTDAYCRLVAMKVFARRASDYMRAASASDRRYLLYNPMVKMKVTTQGEEVVNHLWDVIAAKGFEKDGYFEMAARDIRALPKLEGTVHVNMALIIKFIRNYFFSPARFPDVPRMSQPANDDFLFAQGATRGLGKIQFHDFDLAYRGVDIANVVVFRQQIAVFKEFLLASAMDAATAALQAKDIDFLLTMGELFTLVAYGQLILEYHAMEPAELSADLVGQIFDFMVRDFAKFALQLHSKPSSSARQMELCLRMLARPVGDPERYARVWQEHVFAQAGQYQMNP
ncbi:MAG: acyl-CoA dehydrogenase [Myxococcota bacterium]